MKQWPAIARGHSGSGHCRGRGGVYGSCAAEPKIASSPDRCLVAPTNWGSPTPSPTARVGAPRYAGGCRPQPCCSTSTAPAAAASPRRGGTGSEVEGEVAAAASARKQRPRTACSAQRAAGECYSAGAGAAAGEGTAGEWWAGAGGAGPPPPGSSCVSYSERSAANASALACACWPAGFRSTRRTKLIATIGPACDSEEMLEQIAVGVQGPPLWTMHVIGGG